MYFTGKQLRIMQFIQQFQKIRGISPTLEEIAQHMGVCKITIYEHINQLERKKAVSREKFRARSVEILCSVPETSNRVQISRILTDGQLLSHDDPSTNIFIWPPSTDSSPVLVQTDLYAPDIKRGDILFCAHGDPQQGDWVMVVEKGKIMLKKYDPLKPPKGVCGVITASYRNFRS